MKGAQLEAQQAAVGAAGARYLRCRASLLHGAGPPWGSAPALREALAHQWAGASREQRLVMAALIAQQDMEWRAARAGGSQ